MTAYADYQFYSEEYLSGKAPSVTESDYLYYANKASAVIRQYTLDNIGGEIPDAVKMCCCELAELLYKSDSSKSAQGISSEKVGDASVSYENADSLRQALPKQIKSAVYSWLADTGLLHCGGCLC